MANIKSIELLKNTDTQTTALMLVSEQTQLAIRKGADEFLSKECKVKLRQVAASSGAASGSGQARREGIQDGKNYETSKPSVSGKLN